jgi:hypothetical protein
VRLAHDGEQATPVMRMGVNELPHIGHVRVNEMLVMVIPVRCEGLLSVRAAQRIMDAGC